MSFSTARVNAQIVGHVTAFEISTTDLKSPGLDTGNPASITSTPNPSNAFATWIFSTVFNWQPGTCSPSRKVVSKINNLSLICI
ncbi:unknown [Tannerella sp. CAG:118]|nr:unknown [Tannerella sp. CAG:118]